MDRFDALLLFTRIVELGSFTRAAAELGLPRATATHAIQQLEARLQTRLLERTTRHVRTTPDGQAFHERCRLILAELEDAEGSLRDAAALRGTLRVEMHAHQAQQVVLPRLGEFHARHPGLHVIVSSSDRPVDLLREGMDCVIRSGTPRDSTLVARRLAVLNEIVCASPGYLAEHGEPRTLEALAAHRAVRYVGGARAEQAYPFEFVVDGAIRRVDVPGWLAVGDTGNYIAAALQGYGLIQMPDLGLEPYLRDGRLVRVLAAWAAPPMPVSLMYPHHRQLPLRLRLFADWVATIYRARFGPL